MFAILHINSTLILFFQYLHVVHDDNFRFAVKRFAHLHDQGMEENTVFFECLGNKGHRLIRTWPIDRSQMPWDEWKTVARECFAFTEQKVPGFTNREGPGIPKCLMNPKARQILMSKVFGAFPFYCVGKSGNVAGGSL